MANLLHNRGKLYYVLAGIIALGLITFVIYIQNRPSQKYSSPDLIQLAFAKDEITEEERLLYLAYAIGDYEKLPTRFHSNYPWSGTMIILELDETVNSKEEMCNFSPFIQSELRRILREGVICN